MTAKEAIKGLKNLAKEFSGYKPNEEMFDMAIEALNHSEIPNSSDCISRKAAIDVLISECRNVDSRYLESERIIHESDAIEAISMLPSAQPEQERFLTCNNCIHLGHGYMMPCKNCRRNQMMPDWYEVET